MPSPLSSPLESPKTSQLAPSSEVLNGRRDESANTKSPTKQQTDTRTTAGNATDLEGVNDAQQQNTASKLLGRAAQAIQRTQLKLESDLQGYQAACASFFARKQHAHKKYHHHQDGRYKADGGDEDDEEDEDEDDEIDITSTTSDGSRSDNSHTLSGFSGDTRESGRSGRRSGRSSARRKRKSDLSGRGVDGGAEGEEDFIGSGGANRRHSMSSVADSEAQARYRERELAKIMGMGGGSDDDDDDDDDDDYFNDVNDDDDGNDFDHSHGDQIVSSDDESTAGSSSRVAADGRASMGSLPGNESQRKGSSLRRSRVGSRGGRGADATSNATSSGQQKNNRRNGGARRDAAAAASGNGKGGMNRQQGPIVGYLRVQREEALLLQALREAAKANYIQQQQQRAAPAKLHQPTAAGGGEAPNAPPVASNSSPNNTPPLSMDATNTKESAVAESLPPLTPRGTANSAAPPATASTSTTAATAAVSPTPSPAPAATVFSSQSASSYHPFALGLDNVQLVRVVKAKKRLSDCLPTVAKYSSLCDQLGIRLITYDDVADVLSKRCMAILDPLTLSIDESCVFYIEGRFLVEAMAEMMDALRRRKEEHKEMIKEAESKVFRATSVSSSSPSHGGRDGALLEEAEEVHAAAVSSAGGAAIIVAPLSNAEESIDNTAKEPDPKAINSTSPSNAAQEAKADEDAAKSLESQKKEKKKGFFSSLFSKKEEKKKQTASSDAKKIEVVEQKEDKKAKAATDSALPTSGGANNNKHRDPVENTTATNRKHPSAAASGDDAIGGGASSSSPEGNNPTSASTSAAVNEGLSTHGLHPAELQSVYAAVIRAMLFLIETRVVGIVHSNHHQQQQQQQKEPKNVSGGGGTQSERVGGEEATVELGGESMNNDSFTSQQRQGDGGAATRTVSGGGDYSGKPGPDLEAQKKLAAKRAQNVGQNTASSTPLFALQSPDRFSFILCLDGVDTSQLQPILLLMKKLLPDAYPLRLCGIYLLSSHAKHIEWHLKRYGMAGSTATTYMAHLAHEEKKWRDEEVKRGQQQQQQQQQPHGSSSPSNPTSNSTSTSPPPYVLPPLTGIRNKVRYFLSVQTLKVQLLNVKMMRRLHTVDDLLDVVDVEQLDKALRRANMLGFLPPVSSSIV